MPLCAYVEKNPRRFVRKRLCRVLDETTHDLRLNSLKAIFNFNHSHDISSRITINIKRFVFFSL